MTTPQIKKNPIIQKSDTEAIKLASFIALMPAPEFKGAVGGGISIDPAIALVLAQGILNFQQGAIWNAVKEMWGSSAEWEAEYIQAQEDDGKLSNFVLESVYLEPVVLDGAITGWLALWKPVPSISVTAPSQEDALKNLKRQCQEAGLVR